MSSDCAALLDHQRGVFARWQLTTCPADTRVAQRFVRSGRWQPLYRGVYASYTGCPPRAGVLWAAVLRCGPAAVLSHQSAAELDRLTDEAGGPVHVTIGDQQRVRLGRGDVRPELPRIVLHRSMRIDAIRHPARTPPRTRIEETVLDLTDAAMTFDAAFAWLTAACGRRLVTPGQLAAAAGRRGRLRWREDVLGALEEVTDGVMSGLERRFIRDVEKPHGLPVPVRQARQRRGQSSAYLDIYYPDYNLVVELDGLGAHPAERRWRDIHRDNYLARRGIVTLRYSWVDVTRHGCLVAAEAAVALRQRGWTGEISACPSCPPRRRGLSGQ